MADAPDNDALEMLAQHYTVRLFVEIEHAGQAAGAQSMTFCAQPHEIATWVAPLLPGLVARALGDLARRR